MMMKLLSQLEQVASATPLARVLEDMISAANMGSSGCPRSTRSP